MKTFGMDIDIGYFGMGIMDFVKIVVMMKLQSIRIKIKQNFWAILKLLHIVVLSIL